MKTMKKTLALLIVLVMIAAMLPNALAATVTISTNAILDGHSFTAYQVFSGREDGGILSDVQWGSGIDSAAFLTALKADTSYGDKFADCSDAAAVAVVLGANNTDTTLANAVAKLAHTHKIGNGTELTAGENSLADGYYLVVDTTADVGAGGAYNASLLQVVGNIDIKVKTDVPTVEKKVYEDDKYSQDGGYGAGYNDVADYNIGEAVSFHLIGSLPNMSQYTTYSYQFVDTLSAGLTLNEDTIKVYAASGKDGSDRSEITGWTKAVENGGFTITFDDLKSVAIAATAKFIIVEYTATLNQNAVIGLEGNPNEVYLKYSNHPNQAGTGTTLVDKVIVFTYKLDTTKVDGQDNTKKLEGAKFVLLNSAGDKVAEISNGKFNGWIALPAEDPSTGKITEETWDATSCVLTSDTNGLFSVTGLDDGVYKLREIKAPAGYNLLSEDITVTITATTTNGQTWTDGIASSALTNLAVTSQSGSSGASVPGTGAVDTGTAAISIANNKGATLPSTGGIGTTMFYVIGTILVIGAVVLLVSKKRMNVAE